MRFVYVSGSLSDDDELFNARLTAHAKGTGYPRGIWRASDRETTYLTESHHVGGRGVVEQTLHTRREETNR